MPLLSLWILSPSQVRSFVHTIWVQLIVCWTNRLEADHDCSGPAVAPQVASSWASFFPSMKQAPAPAPAPAPNSRPTPATSTTSTTTRAPQQPSSKPPRPASTSTNPAATASVDRKQLERFSVFVFFSVFFFFFFFFFFNFFSSFFLLLLFFVIQRASGESPSSIFDHFPGTRCDRTHGRRAAGNSNRTIDCGSTTNGTLSRTWWFSSSSKMANSPLFIIIIILIITSVLWWMITGSSRPVELHHLLMMIIIISSSCFVQTEVTWFIFLFLPFPFPFPFPSFSFFSPILLCPCRVTDSKKDVLVFDEKLEALLAWIDAATFGSSWACDPEAASASCWPRL
jgi:hypothetical protein